MLTEVVGWTSSVILLSTIVCTVYEQWRSGVVGGVSPWLFIGQTFASIGFAIYSVLLDNWVFVVTNVALLLAALIGQCVMWRNRRRAFAQTPLTQSAGPRSL